jgi:DNA-binding GntR family transcriptional regulator
MAIDKTKLFESTRGRWPLSFRITPTRGTPPFLDEPDTVAVYRSIEEACEPTGEYTQSDEWTQLANWAFHQALGEVAKNVASEKIVRRDEVTFDLFDKWMRSNLSEECWHEERREYEASPSRFQ